MNINRLYWSDAAERALSPIITDKTLIPTMREQVNDGRMELWLVDGESLALLHTNWEFGYIWMSAYVGKDYRQLMRTLIQIARDNGLSEIRGESPSRVARLMLSGLGFVHDKFCDCYVLDLEPMECEA